MASVRAGGRGGGGGRARRGHLVGTAAENAPTPACSPVEDMELLADADAPDFVDDGEDLEFYEWAAGEVES